MKTYIIHNTIKRSKGLNLKIINESNIASVRCSFV